MSGCSGPLFLGLQGNLCLDAALEFEVASQSVHSPVMTADGIADPRGDDVFRASAPSPPAPYEHAFSNL